LHVEYSSCNIFQIQQNSGRIIDSKRNCRNKLTIEKLVTKVLHTEIKGDKGSKGGKKGTKVLHTEMQGPREARRAIIKYLVDKSLNQVNKNQRFDVFPKTVS